MSTPIQIRLTETERAVMTKTARDALEAYEAVHERYGKVRREFNEAQQAVKSAEFHDRRALADSFKSGDEEPAPTLPAAEAKVAEAQQRMNAARLALQEAADELEAVLERERPKFHDKARQAVDTAYDELEQAAADFAAAVARASAKTGLAWWAEQSANLLAGSRSGIGAIEATAQDVQQLVAEARRLEHDRRRDLDSPQVDAGDEVETTDDGKVRRKVRAEVVW